MLRHTFCHLPGIGPKTEQQWWRAGITTWETYLDGPLPSCPSPSQEAWIELLRESQAALANANPYFFTSCLAPNQQWRLFRDFRPFCAYLDIETTGLGSFDDHVTTIALYDGTTVRHYVYGENLEEFWEDLAAYPVVVTYNGTTFDLPFLQRQFGRPLKKAHIDLRYVLRALGITGGLKRSEKLLGIGRAGLEDLDGYAAVLLWRAFRAKQDPRYLHTLLAYNIQDTINLETIMVEAYNRKVRETPFAADLEIASQSIPHNPFQADPQVVQQVVRAMNYGYAR